MRECVSVCVRVLNLEGGESEARGEGGSFEVSVWNLGKLKVSNQGGPKARKSPS